MVVLPKKKKVKYGGWKDKNARCYLKKKVVFVLSLASVGAVVVKEI